VSAAALPRAVLGVAPSVKFSVVPAVRFVSGSQVLVEALPLTLRLCT